MWKWGKWVGVEIRLSLWGGLTLRSTLGYGLPWHLPVQLYAQMHETNGDNESIKEGPNWAFVIH